MVFISDVIFSKHLQRYPELWGLGKGYISWKEHGRKLADEMTKITGTLITAKDLSVKMKGIRQNLKRLNNSEKPGYTGMCAYMWYAKKLGLTNAVDRMTSQMIAYGELPAEVNCEEVPVEVDCGGVQMDVDCVDFLGFDKKQTEKQTEERAFTTESPDSSNYYSYNVNGDDIYDEGPTTSAEAAQRRKTRRLEPDVNPDEEADIKVHQIIGDQTIPNIQTEECITEDPLENTIKKEEPELEIFPSCSSSSGSESDSAPRTQSASVPQSQNEPAPPICSKETESQDYRKQILNEFRKCNEQIHNEAARNEDFRRKMLQLEEEKIMLLREYLNNAKDIKTMLLQTFKINTNGKHFSNVCQTEEIAAPEDVTEDQLTAIINSDERSSFHIPMSMSDPSITKDKSDEPVDVIDIAVNPKFSSQIEKSLLFRYFFSALIGEP
uniref:PIH1 domain-containing protein n=1 Tax=Glossina austeni TaxID=7395 RepID=A0A1A9UPW6_GLOAU